MRRFVLRWVIILLFLCLTAGVGAGAAPLTLPVSAVEQSYFLPAIIKCATSPFTFITWADTKAGTTTLAGLSNQAEGFKPAFTIFPGDLEANGFSSAGMTGWMKAMGGGNGNGLAEIVFPLRGNHDVLNPNAWQSFFFLQERATMQGMSHFSSLDEDLTYSFDYANAHFTGIDVTGSVEFITERQIQFLDQDLTAAEARKLTHAFLFFHGPLYPVGIHSQCTERICPTSPRLVNLVKVINSHPIVSAVFNGHEHLQAYVHMDASRVPEITNPFEEFISGAAGAELHPCINPTRSDYCGSYTGFAVVKVNGKNFSVSIYQEGQAGPVKSYSFLKQ